MSKPIHAKPSLYAYYFLSLKEIAFRYGYNLVLHGSLNRDLDLIAIPWAEKLSGTVEEMIKEFADHLGGTILIADSSGTRYSKLLYQGRTSYVINLNRGGYNDKNEFIPDPQYYIDISVTPVPIVNDTNHKDD